MTTMLTHAQSLARFWQGAHPSRREELRQSWPELATIIDAVTWRPEGEKIQEQQLPRPRRVPRNNEPRCEATHNPGQWPYVARCVIIANHESPGLHVDGQSRPFRTQVPCDGCKTIQRMSEQLPAGDETAHYELKRAARHHLEECPNR